MNRFFLIIGGVILLIPLLFAQGIAIGQWRDYLPYTQGVAVTDAGNRVYCASTSAIFYYDKTDNSYETVSKATGLSDAGISAIRYNSTLNTIVVAYTNSNIDLLGGSTIINIGDIKRKNIVGKKYINSIFCLGNYAYLSCSFGIVVLDVEKKEIKDTYYIGYYGGSLNVNETTSDGQFIYAATDSGVYKAPYAGANLADYNSWSREQGLPSGKYIQADIFDGKPIVNKYGGWNANQDRLYIWKDTAWVFFLDYTDTNFVGYNVYGMEVNNNLLVISYGWGVNSYDAAGNNILSFGQLWSYDKPRPYDAVLDKDNIMWIADIEKGLVKRNDVFSFDVITPDGPRSKNVSQISVSGGDVWIAPGGRTPQWNNTWNGEGIFYYINGDWKNIDYTGVDSVFDIVQVFIDPANKNHVFAGSWGYGVLEFENTILKTTWNEINTNGAFPLNKRVAGFVYDKNRNLWVGIFSDDGSAKKPLLAMDNLSTWHSFELKTSPSNSSAGLAVDSNNTIWSIIKGSGVFAFDYNGTLDDETDDRYRYRTGGIGYGNLPSNEIYSIATDLNGDIWVGTAKGIAVFYNPSIVFDSASYDAKQILVYQDGYWQYLLEFEAVSAIAVDGANRKWCGTRGAGVFCVSADGTEEVYHFTKENSALLSDDILSVAINQDNGVVFIGTTEGITSFRSDATMGGTYFDTLTVFPNPVKEDYSGPIAISGLLANTHVKITDISGNLIYETVSLGGTAIWYGKNFTGRKAKTGVYLVFCTGSDGAQTAMAKILLIN